MSAVEATASEPNLRGRLIAWLALVAILSGLAYAQNYAVHTSTATKQKALFEYSTAVGSVILYGLLLGVVLLIAGPHKQLLALRPPRSWLRALGLALLVVVAAGFVVQIVDSVLHGGREQGVVPDHWRHGDGGPYAANWVVIAGVAPFVEELTYRGLGCSLIAAFRPQWVAIAATGVLFGASHGFLQALPELAILGCALAWLRFRVDSVYPGMLVHCAFNSFALAQVFF